MDASQNQILFLVTVGLTAIGLFALRSYYSNSRLKLDRKVALSKRLLQTLVAVAVVVLLDAIFFNFLFGNRTVNSIVFSIMLAIACGFAAHRLIQSSSETKSVVSGGWVAIIVITFVIGLFWERLPYFLNSITVANIKTSVGAINLSFSSDENKYNAIDLSPSLGNSTDLSLFERETDYQFGTNMLLQVQARLTSDLERLRGFCSLLGHSSQPSESDGTDHPCMGKFHRIDHGLRHDQKNAEALTGLGKCMDDHAKHFPNGLPAHQLLLKVALAMAEKHDSERGRPDDADQTVKSSGSYSPTTIPASLTPVRTGSTEPQIKAGSMRVHAINNLVIEIQRANRAADRPVIVEGVKVEKKKSSDKADEKEPCALPVEAFSGLDESSDYFRTPHRSITEAAFIVAAGFPYDGAKLLETAYSDWLVYKRAISTKHQDEKTRAMLAITDAIFQIRILSFLDQIYQKVDEKRRGVKVLTKLTEQYNNLFFNILERDLSSFEILSLCADGEFGQSRISGDTHTDAKLRDYFRSIVWIAISVDVRRWQKKREIAHLDEDLSSAETDLLTFTKIIDSNSTYDDCFRPWLDQLAEAERKKYSHELEKTFFEIADAYVSLRMMVINRQIRTWLRHKVVFDRDKVRNALCDAQSAMLVVDNLAVPLDNKDDVIFGTVSSSSPLAVRSRPPLFSDRAQNVIQDIRRELSGNHMTCGRA